MIRFRGFTTGADDYMTKPFEIRELLMRIQAISRRSNHQDTSHPVVGNPLTILLPVKSAIPRLENPFRFPEKKCSYWNFL